MLLVKLQCCLTAWQSGLSGCIPLVSQPGFQTCPTPPLPNSCPSQLCRAASARATQGAESKQEAGNASKRPCFLFPTKADAHGNIPLSSSLAVNTYLFMMQAQGIMIRENMRTIGAQVYEQVVRSAYAKRNSSVNDSGISRIIVILIKF